MISQRSSRRAFIKRAGAGLAGVLLSGRGRAAPPRPSRPNVVLIVLDTVCPDHLSCYGYERKTSPFLETLAESARVYANAYSTSCWTVPAHASLFTGLHVASHGTHWEHYQAEDGLVTLAEVLHAHGYRTFGLCENPSVSAACGFAQGFDAYRIVKQPPRQARSNVYVQFKQCVQNQGNRPFFIFVNLCGPHDPYDSSGQFFKTFLSDPAYANQYRIDGLDAMIYGVPSAKALKHLTEHYDAELRYADYVAEQMAGELRAKGLWDSTLFIVTSDHGENIGDHGLMNHQFCLYETLVRVPLLIHYPECFPPGSQEKSLVQLTDLFPSILRVAGAPHEQFPIQGRSLLPGETSAFRKIVCENYIHNRFANPKRYNGRWLHPKVQHYRRRLTSIRAGYQKYIVGSDGSEELYNLKDDPGETANLAGDAACAARKAKLAQLLEEYIEQCRKGHPPPSEKDVPLDRETEETLKALGYF